MFEALRWSRSKDKIQELLNNRKTRINTPYRSHENFTALHFACYYSPSIDVVKMILKKGANVNARDENDCTPLILACCSVKGFEVVPILLEYGADANLSNKYSETALWKACRNNKVPKKIIEKLVGEMKTSAINLQGTRPYFEMASRSTALHCAIKSGLSKEILDVLVKGGASWKIVDIFGKTPIAYR